MKRSSCYVQRTPTFWRKNSVSSCRPCDFFQHSDSPYPDRSFGYCLRNNTYCSNATVLRVEISASTVCNINSNGHHEFMNDGNNFQPLNPEWFPPIVINCHCIDIRSFKAFSILYYLFRGWSGCYFPRFRGQLSAIY